MTNEQRIERLARAFASHDGYGEIEWGQFDLVERSGYRAYARIALELEQAFSASHGIPHTGAPVKDDTK